MIIVFDFDKTLTKSDTFFPFIWAIMDKSVLGYCKVLFLFYFAVLHKLNIIENSKFKLKAVQYFLKNMQYEILKSRVNKFVKSIKLNEINNEIKTFSCNDIYVVSASFDFAIRDLFSKNITVVGSRINVDDGIVTGMKDNCYGLCKVERLMEIGVRKIDILYTDSISDLPLAQISDEIRFVESGTYTKFSFDEFLKYTGVEKN